MDQVGAERSGGFDFLAEGPDEAREFTRNRHDDFVLVQAARAQAPEAHAQPQLRLPGEIGHGVRHPALAPRD